MRRSARRNNWMVPATKLGFTAGQTTKPLAKGAGQDGLTELCAAGGCMPPEHAITAVPGVPGLISLGCGAHLSAAAWGGAWG